MPNPTPLPPPPPHLQPEDSDLSDSDPESHIPGLRFQPATCAPFQERGWGGSGGGGSRQPPAGGCKGEARLGMLAGGKESHAVHFPLQKNGQYTKDNAPLAMIIYDERLKASGIAFVGAQGLFDCWLLDDCLSCSCFLCRCGTTLPEMKAQGFSIQFGQPLTR